MIDKAVDHAPRACAHIVWHVHVLRMFTEREQEELVNKISAHVDLLVEYCLAFANQHCRRDDR